MHLFFDISPTHFHSFSLIVSLPLSFFWYLSHTLFLYTSLRPLLSLSLSLAPSHFYSPYRYYFVIGSPYLTLSLIFSLFDATSDCSSLHVCDIIPLLLSFLLWYDYHNHCFCFNNNKFFSLCCRLLIWRWIFLRNPSSQFLMNFCFFLYFFIFLFLHLLHIHISDKFLFFFFSLF